MEESTPTRKKSFSFLRSSEEKKSSTKKGSRKNSAADKIEGEQLCETPKTSEDAELKQAAHQVGKEKGKKKKKTHMRHFSFGGKFHKHKAKETKVAGQEETASSSECFGSEMTGSRAGQAPVSTSKVDDEKTEDQREVAEEGAAAKQNENGDATAGTGSTVETVPLQICVSEKEESPEAAPERQVAESTEPELEAGLSDEEGNVEAELCVQGQNCTTKNDQNNQVAPERSSQSEGDKIGDQAGESEFQMTKEQEVGIPSSPKETTSEKDQNNGKQSSSKAENVAPDIPTTAPLVDDASPQNDDPQEESKKEPDAEEENTSSLGISSIYQVLLCVKASLVNGQKLSSFDTLSGVPYEICQVTVNTGRDHLSNLLEFVLGQAGYSTRHVLGYFVKILIQKYPHCFQVKTNGKQKRSKGNQRKDGTRLDTVR